VHNDGVEAVDAVERQLEPSTPLRRGLAGEESPSWWTLMLVSCSVCVVIVLLRGGGFIGVPVQTVCACGSVDCTCGRRTERIATVSVVSVYTESLSRCQRVRTCAEPTRTPSLILSDS
jgi:hypothetical protein